MIRAIHREDADEEVDEEDEEEGYDFESILPHGLLRDYEEKEVVTEHTQAIQDILTRAKVTRTVNTQQAIFKPETTSPKEEQVQEDAQGTGVSQEEMEQQTIRAVQSLLGNLNVTCEFAYKEYSEKLVELLSRLRVNKSLRNQLKSTFLSHAEDPSLLWRQQQGLRNLQRLQLLYGDDIGLVGTFLANMNPGLRVLAQNILMEVYQISEKQALRKELQKVMRYNRSSRTLACISSTIFNILTSP